MLEVVIGELVVQNPISSRFNAMIQRALIFFLNWTIAGSGSVKYGTVRVKCEKTAQLLLLASVRGSVGCENPRQRSLSVHWTISQPTKLAKLLVDAPTDC